MNLNEVKVYPRVYNIIETIDSRFTTGSEIKVCHINNDSLLVAIGSGLAFLISKKEAEQTKVEPR
jgi:hypothetical protein